MTKVLLFGATGNLGQAIARTLHQQGYHYTAVIRDKQKAALFDNYIIADVCNPATLSGICEGYEVVISALGKSVSLNDKSRPSFRDIDLQANSNILKEASKSGIRKFIYVSAYQAEMYLHLEYFKVHHEFSERLKASGLNYSIIKPPAIFCAFLDIIELAKQGKSVNIGAGDKTTNPIYEGDLARICVDAITTNNTTIEAGGKGVYTRKQLLEIIQKAAAPEKKIRNIPLWVLKFSLPFIRLFNKNNYDKFAFFVAVMQHHTLAPQLGEMRFEEYIRENT